MIETHFQKFGQFITSHPKKALILCLFLIILQSPLLFELKLDTSSEGFFRKEKPILKDYQTFKNIFGRDEFIIIALKAENIFSTPFLKGLLKLHDKLENIPRIKSVQSLMNIPIRDKNQKLFSLYKIINTSSPSEALLSQTQQSIHQHPLYKNIFLSKNGHFTAIILETECFEKEVEDDIYSDFLDDFEDSTPLHKEMLPLSDQSNALIVSQVNLAIEENLLPETSYHLAGSPVVTHQLKYSMTQNLKIFIFLTALIIIFFLFSLFKKWSLVLFPLLIVFCSLSSTLFIMSILDKAIKLPTMILPSFLLSVGIGDSIHIITFFIQEFKKPKVIKQKAIISALKHSALPVIMTTLTTAAGLLSFAPTELAPVADLGLFAPLGVFFALFFTLILLPALLSIFPFQQDHFISKGGPIKIIEAFLHLCSHVSAKHPKKVCLFFLFLFLLSWHGLSLLNFSHNPLKWLSATSPARQATEVIDSYLEGSVTVEILIDGGAKNSWYSPELLKVVEKIENFSHKLKKGELSFKNTLSPLTLLKEAHSFLVEGPPSKEIPLTRDAVAQIWLLLQSETPSVLNKFIDAEFRYGRMTIRVPWVNSREYISLLYELEKFIEDHKLPEMECTVTGMLPLFTRTVYAVMNSLSQSYLIAFLLIGLMMVYLIGDFKVGLLSMVPNLFPILFTLAIMGWFKIPLDMFTLLIGSIALGLAVDDTIHFIHHFRKNLSFYQCSQKSIHKTIQTTGKAMLFTSLVLSSGFLIFSLSSMNNLKNFGILTALTIMIAFFSDILLAPALMSIYYNSHQKVKSDD